MPEKPPRILPAVLAVARVVTLEALRGRVAWVAAACMLAGVGLAAFSAEIAITESREVARSVLGAWLRVTAVVVVVLFVATSMARDWSDKGVELVLALPLPRGVWLVGRLAGYAAVALGIAMACTGLLLVYAPPGAVLIWGATLACELLLLAAVSVLCLLTLTQPAAGLAAVFAFYLLARSMDAFRLMAASTPAAGDGAGSALAARILDVVAFLMPDLHRFARSEWLVHGGALAADLLAVVAQTLVYVTLIVAAALFDLERKAL
jgi:hypothetical protein